MTRTFGLFLAAALIGGALPAHAQPRGPIGREHVDVARAQGVPPGHLPPPTQCRVWYDHRPNGRQPAPTNCRQAEAVAVRDRTARVIYGVDAYRDVQYGRSRGYPDGRRYPDEVYRDNGRYPDSGRYPDDERAVRRPGSVRDPRISGGVLSRGDLRRYSNGPAFENGYRDGLTKGREDAEDRDRFDVNRHRWYRSASRGYERDMGPRDEYERIYRQGFEAGYAEGYRVYTRR